jgi:exodeoxyribonuclease VII large subunit
MSQFSIFSEQHTWSVSELTRYIREALESDYRLQQVWVSGEISNLSRPASGHLYFTLQDEGAALRCVMWRSQVDKQTYMPSDGDAVEVAGQISVYEAGGQYQLYADQIRPVGEGLILQQFLEMKSRLEQEGLFDPERKRPLPEWPQRIGVITSPTGAALQDVVNVLRRRYPIVEVLVSPTRVQGDEAPNEIVEAFDRMNAYGNANVVLLVRGGGSMEDLAAFNDERVVRAIVASSAPVVSGIGHETDLILADFAADRRAPTPSAAAELATPDRDDILEELRLHRRAIQEILQTKVLTHRRALIRTNAMLRLLSPRVAMANARQRVDELQIRVQSASHNRVQLLQAAHAGLRQTLQAFDPYAVLGRGYSVVTRHPDGELVRSIHQVSMGEGVRVRVADGSFQARVDAEDQLSHPEES